MAGKDHDIVTKLPFRRMKAGLLIRNRLMPLSI